LRLTFPAALGLLIAGCQHAAPTADAPAAAPQASPPPAAVSKAPEAAPAKLSEADLAKLERARAGLDPKAEPAVRHTLLFSSKSAAWGAAGKAMKAGYAAEVHDEDLIFQVLATRKTPLDEKALVRAREELADLAEDAGGKYIGWDLATPAPKAP
jgi:hypothetical protein